MRPKETEPEKVRIKLRSRKANDEVQPIVILILESELDNCNMDRNVEIFSELLYPSFGWGDSSAGEHYKYRMKYTTITGVKGRSALPEARRLKEEILAKLLKAQKPIKYQETWV